ncbi:MAG: glycosyltransferase family 2 protein [Alphaproteobacteria bacterium]|nr:glycosyltransferase family 2 protein [Alphaproteobacteria bacterium]
MVHASAHPGPALAVVVPTRDEHENIRPLYERLCAVLEGIDWEAIFVDDDSADGTPQAVLELARTDRRVRLIRRIGRRGLASACIEGIQASAAPFVAVMDADLQHDEALLPRMLKTLQEEPFDIVVGSRYAAEGGVGDWDEKRARLSAIATSLGQWLLRVSLTDPMSGFFMLRRDAFELSMRRLSTIGFKVLLDILASSPRPLRVKELPYRFRARQAGESKFDALTGVEYLLLLADKLVGRILPIRLVLFSVVGALGIVVHLAVLWLFLSVLGSSFLVGQTAATAAAIAGNFTLNNWLTYRDVRLAGWRWFGGLLSFALVCSVGAVGNIGVASLLFGQRDAAWWAAGIAGAAMSLVWNYAMTSILTWRRPQ